MLPGSNFNQIKFFKLCTDSDLIDGKQITTGLNTNPIKYNPDDNMGPSGGFEIVELGKLYEVLDPSKGHKFYREVTVPTDANLIKLSSSYLIDKCILADLESIVLDNWFSPMDLVEQIHANPALIAYIKNQTPELAIVSVLQSGLLLKYIHPSCQTREVCLIGLEENGLSLEFVNNPIPEYYMIAVRSNGWALKFVPEEARTNELCLEAVKDNGLALEYVINQTQDICTQALKEDGIALEFVKEQTEELCKLAVSDNGEALEFVKNPTEEICRLALGSDGLALRFIEEKNQTVELVRLAQGNNPRASEYIKIKPEHIVHNYIDPESGEDLLGAIYDLQKQILTSKSFSSDNKQEKEENLENPENPETPNELDSLKAVNNL